MKSSETMHEVFDKIFKVMEGVFDEDSVVEKGGRQWCKCGDVVSEPSVETAKEESKKSKTSSASDELRYRMEITYDSVDSTKTDLVNAVKYEFTSDSLVVIAVEKDKKEESSKGPVFPLIIYPFHSLIKVKTYLDV